jgi:hypothetical protein
MYIDHFLPNISIIDTIDQTLKDYEFFLFSLIYSKYLLSIVKLESINGVNNQIDIKDIFIIKEKNNIDRVYINLIKDSTIKFGTYTIDKKLIKEILEKLDNNLYNIEIKKFDTKFGNNWFDLDLYNLGEKYDKLFIKYNRNLLPNELNLSQFWYEFRNINGIFALKRLIIERSKIVKSIDTCLNKKFFENLNL